MDELSMNTCSDDCNMEETPVEEVRKAIIPKVRVKHITLIVEDREFNLTEEEIKEATGKDSCWAFNRLCGDDDVMKGALLKGLREYAN
jgi:hypothetical protein